jgi:hypothetical protein
MSIRMWLRSGLLFLTITQVVVGGWILLLPHSFYALPWVGLHMPFNEHLLLDLGAMNIVVGIVLGAAAIIMELRLIRVALLAYLVLTVSHLAIHTRYLDHLPPADSALLMTVLSAAVALPAALLPLTRRIGVTAGQEPQRQK